jgi:uracil-DNA glycosylase
VPIRGGVAAGPADSGAVLRGASRQRAWQLLSEEIRRCTLCPLSRSRTQAVVYRGSLEPRVVFVGEAPGAKEDRLGVPFVGRSGQMLDRAIGSLGEDVGAYGVLNVLKCRPPGNRFVPRAARTCRPYLDRQLALLRPRALVPLGSRALLSLEPASPPILTVAGAPQRGARGPYFPMIHPAAALRSRRLRERWERDVGALGRWLADGALESL